MKVCVKEAAAFLTADSEYWSLRVGPGSEYVSRVLNEILSAANNAALAVFNFMNFAEYAI